MWLSNVMAIVHGDPIPPKEKWADLCETVHISPKVATAILELLKKTNSAMKPGANAKEIATIIDTFGDKLDVERSGNIERKRL